MKTSLLVAACISLAACSSQSTPEPITPDNAKSKSVELAPSVAPQQTQVAAAAAPKEEKPIKPSGFAGIPWRTCTILSGPQDCKLTAFRNTSLGMQNDGSDASLSDPNSPAYLFTSQPLCQGNVCRADLANGHQCMHGDTVTCTGSSAGTSTCSNGAWGACVASLADRPETPPKDKVPAKTASKEKPAPASSKVEAPSK